MPSPFPGMNPYLENPDLWPEVHYRLITAIAIAIAPPLRPKYRVAIEKRTYFSEGDQSVEVGIPDVSVVSQASSRSTSSVATLPESSDCITVTLPVPQEIREGFLEIREVATGRVVTVIELLSPTNKRSGKGRDAYEDKRRDVLSSPTHLVEIDLLRGGKPMQTIGQTPQTDYRILIGRREQRPHAQLYAFSVRQVIPKFALPLEREDPEPFVDLRTLLDEIYDQAGFDLVIDYTLDPIPPLRTSDKAWANTLLQEQGLRSAIADM